MDFRAIRCLCLGARYLGSQSHLHCLARVSQTACPWGLRYQRCRRLPLSPTLTTHFTRPRPSLNQLMRLLAHHNLPLRLIRLLPRLLQAQAAAAAAAAEAEAAASGWAGGEGGGAARHVRVPSVPQVSRWAVH